MLPGVSNPASGAWRRPGGGGSSWSTCTVPGVIFGIRICGGMFGIGVPTNLATGAGVVAHCVMWLAMTGTGAWLLSWPGAPGGPSASWWWWGCISGSIPSFFGGVNGWQGGVRTGTPTNLATGAGVVAHCVMVVFSYLYFSWIILRLCTDFQMKVNPETDTKMCGGGSLNVNLVFYFGPNLFHSSLSFGPSRTINRPVNEHTGSLMVFFFFSLQP